MKTIIKTTICLFVLITASCNSKTGTDTPIVKAEVDFQKDTTGCDCSDLTEGEEDNIMSKDGAKYTGICTTKQFDDKSNKEYRQYKNGLLDGTFHSWYENGKPKIKIDFTKGLVHGKFEEWNEKGKQITDLSFDQGKLHGISYVFHEDGIRYALFLADSKSQRFDRTVYNTSFDDDFKSYKPSFNSIGLTGPIICISTHFEESNMINVISDYLEGVEDLNSYLDFVKQFEKDHKVKIVIDRYENKSSTFDRSQDYSVWKSYDWIVKGKKKEIDNKIHKKMIAKKIGFDPAFINAFNNGVKQNTTSSSNAKDIFEDDESDEGYNYTR